MSTAAELTAFSI